MSTIDLNHPLTICRASAGTGKTYTLSAYYIAMLLSGESYRNILAVTFTNAATAEMKERILTYLLRIAHGEEKDLLTLARTYMLRDAGASDELLQARANENLHAILQDYDNFSVTTIDSFLQQLIRGMAKAINRTADFAISLDAEQVITAAVDNMLTTELSDKSKKTIYEYIEQSIGDGGSWDIRENLIQIGEQLYLESVQVHSTHLGSDSPLELDEQRIAQYKKALHAKLEAAKNKFRPVIEAAKQAMDTDTLPYSLSGREMVSAKSAIKNMYESLRDADAKGNDAFRGATDTVIAKLMADKQYSALQQACDAMRHVYWQVTCSLTYLNDMRLMRALQDSIQQSLTRTNTALLADTAVTLAQALKPGDADFILEKAGIRYRHVMIDEFQDTSLLQWSVMTHLLEEVLAVHGQTVLIVGDTKQSIYRFRNGNWQIMEGLGRTQMQNVFNSAVQPLVRNQRSRENVVQFNLGVMSLVAKQTNLQIPVTDTDERMVGEALYDEKQDKQPLSIFYRTDKHPGGSVRCRFYPYYTPTKDRIVPENLLRDAQQQALWDNACATIEELLAAGERPEDILILARFNKEIQKWAAYCRQQGDAYPRLNATPLVSRDSFQLESCLSVLLLMSALRYLTTGDKAAAEFIRMHRGSEVIERIGTIDKSAPLYDRMQHLIQALLCEQGTYIGDDTAYINCLMDHIEVFIATHGGDARALLQYWDDKLHEQAINGDSSVPAIHMMSVHSSKGLEGKTVILLDAAWETEGDHPSSVLWLDALPVDEQSLSYIPVRQTSSLKQTGEQSSYYRAYRKEHEAQLIDNYNLLYVALTRAADNLYVYALLNRTKYKPGCYPTVAASLLEYTGLQGQLDEPLQTGDSYLEFAVGTVHINRPTASAEGSELKFTGATPISAPLYSDGQQVHFRQSQESTQYTLNPEEAEQVTAQTDFGILCHDIFAHIARQQDARQVVDTYRRQGLIDSDEQYQRIIQLIGDAFTSPQMQHWFDGSWQLMRESAILTPSTLIRPDRVMIRGDKAIVLDYKFTDKQRPSHILQVREYMDALRRMNYPEVEGWLWYAFTNQLIRVTL